MKTITSKQQIPILVDDENYDLLMNFEWSVYDRYAQTTIHGKTIKMHRLLLGLNVGENIHVDHKNGVTTDNRVDNIRVCTRCQNQHNRKTNINSKTGIKGVVKIPSGHYRVRVQADGIRYDIGVFKTAEEAKNAREKFAKEKHQEFFR